MDIYIVQSGDTINSIASTFQISSDSIIYNNQIPSPYRLVVGQSLLLSTGIFSAKRPEIHTNGYAYPFISNYVLEQTLPFLSELSIFSYGFTAEGDLIPPALDDTPLIQAAFRYGTRPILTLTPLNDEGRFNDQLITIVVNDPAIRDHLIAQLIDVMATKGFLGINVDFEYIKAEDKEPYVDFIWTLRIIMNQLGYSVSVALAPKSTDRETSVLTAGLDYEKLGAAANSVLLMTYEWGFAYGPPMSVAPINQVRQVVEYALSHIPAEKINLGIPNYGYDWPLPYIEGKSRARTIGNIEAIQLALAYQADIHFDEVSQTPYFYYTEYQTQHVVWFEDVRSLDAKFNLTKEYNLQGVGYWQIMQLFRANWLLLADRFKITKQLP